MSLDTEVAQLTGRANTLIDTFENKSADIEARILAALQAVPDGDKIFYVDQIAGSDSNTGESEDLPLKTIGEAVNRTPIGGVADILLLSDYVMDNDIFLENKLIRLKGVIEDDQNRKNLSFLTKAVNGEIITPSFVNVFGGGIHLYGLVVNLPDVSGMNGSLGSRSACFGPRSSSDSMSFIFKITYSDIIVPNEAAALLNHSSNFMFIAVFSCTVSGNMPGHWIRGIPAGTLTKDEQYLAVMGISSL